MLKANPNAARTLLAVDLSYQTYRAAAAHPMLSYDGVFTGGVFGFLTTLAKQIRETGASEVVICQDRKPYRRSLLYPEYKMLRKAHQDEDLLEAYVASQPLVMEAIEEIGLPVMGVDGFESDDCIGWIVKQQRHRWRKIYAASNDSDLYQLFWCPWFAVLRKDLSDCVDYWRIAAGPMGMSPEEFMLSTALQGTHNDIAGIPGVGPKRAYDAVKNPALMRSYRERYASLIDRNLALIKLPHPVVPHIRLPPATKSFDHRALYRWASRYGIEVTKSMIDSFEQVSP